MRHHLAKYKFILSVLLFGIFACDPEIIIREVPVPYDPHALSCPQETSPFYLPGAMSHGRVAGLKNCNPFIGEVTLRYDTSVQLLTRVAIRTYEKVGLYYWPKEVLEIVCHGTSLGYYPMGEMDTMGVSISTYLTVRDSAILEDTFRLDPAFPWNGIALTAYNPFQSKLAGEFQCRFLLSSLHPSGMNPDTVLFSECRFDTWK